MKNIYIVGVPRAGKSTLSKMIKERYPIYNQISFEAVRNGFMESQEELDMGNRNSDARKNILPKHITTFAYWNNKILGAPSLVEGSFCSIGELLKLVSEDDLIICLGLGCRSIEEVVEGIKKHDSEKDYTSDWSYEQLKLHFRNTKENDKLNYEFCLENNIKYYDTFENRDKVFEDIIQSLN